MKSKDLLKLKGNACYYCGKIATTVDHVIPKSAGGKSDSNNLVPSCYKCNQRKAARSYKEFTGEVYWRHLLNPDKHYERQVIKRNKK